MLTFDAVMSGSGVSGVTVRKPVEPYKIEHFEGHAPEFASRIPCRNEPGPESAFVVTTYACAGRARAKQSRRLRATITIFRRESR